MIDTLHFAENDLILPASLLGLGLFLVFLWKEWRGRFERSFIVNSIVALLAIIALAALVLQPSIYENASSKGAVLTKGYRLNQLDSLKKEVKNIKTIRYRPGESLKKSLQDLDEIVLLGQGVQPFDFWQLDSHPVSYKAPGVPKGITHLKYTVDHKEGDSLIVSGVFNKPKPGNKLSIQGIAGKPLDSIGFSNVDSQEFRLKTRLNVAGRFVYKLVEKDSLNNELASEPLPIKVVGKEPLKILIVNSFPSFETKYLKNFLAEEGHEVVVRSQITKQKYKFEYFNTERVPVYRFSEQTLKNFDLLIFDVPSYFKLSRLSKKEINTVVSNEGTGVFVQPEDGLFKRMKNFTAIPMKRDGISNMALVDMPKLKLEKHPYTFRFAESLKGNAIENYGFYHLEGKGRKGTFLLKNTYQLQLNGKTKAYRRIWTQMVNTLSRKSFQIGEFKALSEPVFQHQPYVVKLATAMENPIVTQKEGFVIPAIRNVFLRDSWHLTSYPRTTGWNTLALVAEEPLVHDYFVLDSTNWKNVVGAKLIAENQRYFNLENHTSKKIKVSRPISPFWFFIVFVLSSAYLWLQPKLRK